MSDDASAPREVARRVLEIEAAAVSGLLGQLDETFDRAIQLIRKSTGRVICTGMGKSGLVMRKVAATLSSTGTPSFFLHPAEAIHGDLGVVTGEDVVLAASYSGRTEELLRLAEVLKRQSIPMVMMTGDHESPLATISDLHLRTAIDKEACPLNLAPTASTTALLALGDALAMALLESRGFTPEDFGRLHPGGQLGRRLLTVENLMRTGDKVPSVELTSPMSEAIYEMSNKGIGVTAVVDGDGVLQGVISDGDLRRLMEIGGIVVEKTASDCMHGGPKTIDCAELASAALKMMEDHRITSLFVANEAGRLEGVVHIHDLWGLELF